MLGSENFKRGTTELVVLCVLQKEDMYGYQIVQEIEKLSNGNYKLVLGTLYPVLYRFVENEYVSDRDEIVNKRLRKYYHLEEKGREYYKQLLDEYRKISAGVELITKGGEEND
ncbi:MAG: PadR family transcriptional regulator [Faecalibacterium sp.]|nr:PadR family transcriptional regulator [Ruminococcus sp.]MCM1392487.1 PadR family transcriptional regulator [Ruminococcus sp.]MCM1485178.1 PadR family transcriptional regulator [Faecalibacterium sp.]